MLKRMAALALACALGAAGYPSTAKAPAPAPIRAKAPSRPNVLLIIADDVGQDVASQMYPGLIARLSRQYGPRGHNNPGYRRIAGKPASIPALARFARQGMVFSEAWAEPSGSPTRAALLTGLYPANTRVISDADALSQKHYSFVRQLREQGGYASAAFGKWPVAGVPAGPRQAAAAYPGMKPREAGFDLYRGDLHAALPTYWDYPVAVQDAATSADTWRVEQAAPRSLPGLKPTTFADVAKAADAIAWIAKQRRERPGQPWFAWLAFDLSHATLRAQPSRMAIPDKQLLDAATIREIDACHGKYGTQDPGKCSGPAQMRAMTNAMDTIIGKVLAVVDKLPNTYVIVVGDNGTPMYGRPGLDFIDNLYITRKERGKGSAFESGARVAWAIRGPGIKPGGSSREYVHVVDLAPTILQLAGLAPPHLVPSSAGDRWIPLDGISLGAILKGQASRVRDPAQSVLTTENADPMKQGLYVAGARNGRWKLVCAKKADNCAFYNLADDPLEEYPLPRPGNCADAKAAKPDQPAWNYCYLQDAVAKRSILSPSFKPQT